MGGIVFWTIVRIVLLLPLLWISRDYLDFQLWWLVSIFAIYVVIIHPAIVQYRLFEEKNKDIIHSTLCSTCRHFDESAVLCMKYDKHPTQNFLPCNGLDWEPHQKDIEYNDLES